jgi:hypothetical protein
MEADRQGPRRTALKKLPRLAEKVEHTPKELYTFPDVRQRDLETAKIRPVERI